MPALPPQCVNIYVADLEVLPNNRLFQTLTCGLRRFRPTCVGRYTDIGELIYLLLLVATVTAYTTAVVVFASQVY
jgi:hypothetical protein